MILTDFGAPKSDKKYTFLGRRFFNKKTCFFEKRALAAARRSLLKIRVDVGGSQNQAKSKKVSSGPLKNDSCEKNIKNHEFQ